MFIDLTVVEKDEKQSYATLNTDFIKLIDFDDHIVHLAVPGEYIELTEESTLKLVDTLADVGLMIGQDYQIPKEEK